MGHMGHSRSFADPSSVRAGDHWGTKGLTSAVLRIVLCNLGVQDFESIPKSILMQNASTWNPVLVQNRKINKRLYHFQDLFSYPWLLM